MTTVNVSGGTTSEGSNVAFTFSLTTPSAEQVQVPFQALGGTAISGEDVRTASGVVTFEPGQALQTVQFFVWNDNIDEPDESFLVELGTPVNAQLPRGLPKTSAVGWVVDDLADPNARPSVHVLGPIVPEGDAGLTTAVFTLELSRPATTDLAVPYQVRGDSATASEDFVPASGTVTIPEGAERVTIPFDVRGDRVPEGLEHVDLVLDLPAGLQAAGGGRATILDDDGDSGLPRILLSGGTAIEGSWMPFTVALSEPSNQTVTVSYTARGGSAIAGEDFRAPDGIQSISFAPGETLKTVQLFAWNDRIFERDESVVLEVASATNAVVPGEAGQASAVGWFVDRDQTQTQLPVLHVSDIDVVEGDAGRRSATFSLELSRPAPESLSFEYRTVAGTARDGEDFVGRSGTVTIPAGLSAASVGIPVIGDTFGTPRDGEETFTLAVRSLGGAIPGVTGTATILDDDPVIRGTDEGEAIPGTAVGEAILGGGGNDVLSGNGGDDALFGEAGDDRLDGGPGDDALDGGPGRDTVVHGGEEGVGIDLGRGILTGEDAGRDDLAAIENAIGGPDDDVIAGSGGGNRIDGGFGDDRIDGRGGRDALDGEGGDDTIDGGGGRDLLRGGAGRDHLSGGGGRDVIDGGPGRDRIDGGGGPDVVSYESAFSGVRVDLGSGRGRRGEAQGDRYERIEDVAGSPFDDRIGGDEGDNRLSGGGGNDRIGGGQGDDRLSGDRGDDAMDGGAGGDILAGGGGDDLMAGGAGADTLRGGGSLDTLAGGGGNDDLAGGGRGDVLLGGDGRDTLDGGSGNDRLDGGNGPDRLVGSGGKDTLEGGPGGDTFLFGRRDGFDRIVDFDTRRDAVDLTALDTDFASLAIRGRAGGEDALVRHEGGRILIEGVSPDALTEDAFLF